MLGSVEQPNIPTFWPTPNVKDCRASKVTYKAAKEADPECVIIAGSTSGPDFGFIRGIFDNGAWDSCDAISIHPYSMAGGPGSQRLGELLEMANDCIASTGKDKPLWITEMGWTSSSSEEDARQAAYLTQSYVIAAVQGVDKLFWFKLEDWSEKWGIVKADGTKKPAYKAYQTLTKNLTSPVLVGPLQLAPELEGTVPDRGLRLFVTWSRQHARERRCPWVRIEGDGRAGRTCQPEGRQGDRGRYARVRAGAGRAGTAGGGALAAAAAPAIP